METDSVSSKTDALNIFGSFTKKNKMTITNKNLAPAPLADTYEMNHKRRGSAIIFNHVNFSLPECSTRRGSNRDKEELVKIFDEMKFDVLPYDDLTAYEVLNVLQTVSEMDHTDCDCLVIVVMSHGLDGKVYAKDGHYPTKTLWKYFNARMCPSLAGKPKLFFIQACRGTGLHQNQVLYYKQTKAVEEDVNSTDDAFYTIPVMADILVMYSTIEGYYSWRDPQNGGCFIQSLVKQLRSHCETKDLLTILTFVNREVAIDFESYDPYHPELNEKKQMCSIVSMLTRLLYFCQEA